MLRPQKLDKETAGIQFANTENQYMLSIIRIKNKEILINMIIDISNVHFTHNLTLEYWSLE